MPKTIGNMASWVAFVNYFSAHLSDPIRYLKPLRKAMVGRSKAALFPWDAELTKKYEEMVKQLKNLPSFFVAEVANKNANYFLFTDASSQAVGSLLCVERLIKKDSLEGKNKEALGMAVPTKFSAAGEDEYGVLVPVSFFSHQYNGSEQNYSIVAAEVLAVTAGLERFEHLLRGRKCAILSDNSFVYNVWR